MKSIFQQHKNLNMKLLQLKIDNNQLSMKCNLIDQLKIDKFLQHKKYNLKLLIHLFKVLDYWQRKWFKEEKKRKE